MKARASRLTQHGAPLEVDEVELPDPSEGEVVVRMVRSAVNPVDRYQALGRVASEQPLPRTLGSEGAGFVQGGEDRRAVFLNRNSLVRKGDGLWASFVLARRDKLIPVPDGVDLAAAASVGVAGVTAWRCVTELGEADADDRVLVLGASGGVGSIAVSVAHRLGAEVVGQTSSADKSDFVRGCGADRVVVCDADSLVEELGSWRPTLVLDPLGDGYTGAALTALELRGRLVIFGTSADGSGKVPLQTLYRNGLRILGYGGLNEPEEAIATAARESLRAIADGGMEIVVGETIPLTQVNEALAMLERRQVAGKIVLDLEA